MDRKRREEIVREHTELSGRTASLRERLAAWRRGGAVDREAIAEDIVAFRDHIRQHFALEERSGYLADLDADAHATAEVEALFAEHRDMEQRLDEVVVRLVTATATAEEIVPRVFSLLEGLAAHERREAALFRHLARHGQGSA